MERVEGMMPMAAEDLTFLSPVGREAPDSAACDHDGGEDHERHRDVDVDVNGRGVAVGSVWRGETEAELAATRALGNGEVDDCHVV